MIRRLALVIILILPLEKVGSAQNVKIPRDLPRLLARVQDFWTALAANQRLKALEFVHPDKKEFLLSSGGLPFVSAQVLGIDFTGDTNRAAVRVSARAISRESASGQLSWVVTDTWIWDKNNWFLDLEDPKGGANPFASSRKPAADSDGLRAEAESRIKILDNVIQLGTVVRSELRRVPVRIEYTGDGAIWIESGMSSELVSVESISSQEITPESKDFALLLNTEAWEGPFAIPYPLKIHYKGITFERVVTVQGNIFAAITATQSPSPFTNVPGQDLVLSIRNNTDETVKVASIGTGGLFEVVRFPPTVPSNGQADLVLKLKPNAKADPNQPIQLNLEQPLNGKRIYDLRLNVRPNP